MSLLLVKKVTRGSKGQCKRTLDNARVVFEAHLTVAEHWVTLPPHPQGALSRWCVHLGWAWTLPCSSPSSALGEGRAGTCRWLSLPAAWGWAICCLCQPVGWGASSSLISSTTLTSQQSPAPLPPTFCPLFQRSVVLPFSMVLLCSSCPHPQENPCCVFVYSVCVLCPLARAPRIFL